MAIVDNLFWNTGQFVLGAVIGTTAVAIYGVAIQLHGMHEQFSTAMSALFLPRVTAMVSKSDNRQEISDLFIRVGRLQYIILSFILVAFILLGRDFVILWAGHDYQEAYIITTLFFLATTIPLCQNMGIIILQARNQMKFRALCYCFTSVLCVVIQIILAKQFAGIGCAIGLASSVLLGHVVIMNWYYYKKQGINIMQFWKEILRMSIPSILVGVSAFILLKYINLDVSWSTFIVEVVVFALIYLPIAFCFQMNQSERDLIKNMLLRRKRVM